MDHLKFNEHDVADRKERKIYTLTLPKRYTNVKFISVGSQGVVVSADDAIAKRRVAIKMIQPFQLPLSALRAVREFSILSTLKHPNIVENVCVFTPQKDEESFEDIYLVMELMEYNLRSGVQMLKLNHALLSFIIYQILCGVNHLHCEDIIHRDLKPTNIALNMKGAAIKLLDFGFARHFNESTEKMSSYVVTRFYRAPEVVLEQKYTKKVDVWSIGCIFAELITGQVMFPGEDRHDQWKQIVKKMGSPSQSFVSQLRPNAVSDWIMFDAAQFLRQFSRYPEKSMQEIVPDSYFEGYDPSKYRTADDARRLLEKMLKIDPNERYTISQLLQDPYVKRYSKDEELNAPLAGDMYDSQFDEEKLCLGELKSRIFREVKSKEPSFQ